MTDVKTAKASARKSLGEYKPLIVHSNGRTEVCEKSPERLDVIVVGKGVIKGNRMARGCAYATKEQAVAVAQSWIDFRRKDAERRLALYSSAAYERVGTDKILDHVRGEVRYWGGQA